MLPMMINLSKFYFDSVSIFTLCSTNWMCMYV